MSIETERCYGQRASTGFYIAHVYRSENGPRTTAYYQLNECIAADLVESLTGNREFKIYEDFTPLEGEVS